MGGPGLRPGACLCTGLMGGVAQALGIEPSQSTWNARFTVWPASLAVYACMALGAGIEPATFRLTAGCSTAELPKNGTRCWIRTSDGLLRLRDISSLPSAARITAHMYHTFTEILLPSTVTRLCVSRYRLWYEAFASLHCSHLQYLYDESVPCEPFAAFLPLSARVFIIWHPLHNTWHFDTSAIILSIDTFDILDMSSDFFSGSMWSISRRSRDPHFTHLPPNLASISFLTR